MNNWNNQSIEELVKNKNNIKNDVEEYCNVFIKQYLTDEVLYNFVNNEVLKYNYFVHIYNSIDEQVLISEAEYFVIKILNNCMFFDSFFCKTHNLKKEFFYKLLPYVEYIENIDSYFYAFADIILHDNKLNNFVFQILKNNISKYGRYYNYLYYLNKSNRKKIDIVYQSLEVLKKLMEAN